MKNGKYGAPFRCAAECFENARFGFGVEVCGDLVEKKNLRIGNHSGLKYEPILSGRKLFLFFVRRFYFLTFSVRCGNPARLSVFDATYTLSRSFAKVSASLSLNAPVVIYS